VTQRGIPWRFLLRVGAAAALIGLAAFLLYRTLSRYEPDDLVSSVLSVPLPHILAAMGWAAASYLCLTCFDWLGLQYVGRRLPYRKVALASFVSLSLGHNIGFGGLSSGAIRYRYYSREGLGAVEVAKLVVFCGSTVGLGLVTLAGVAVLARPDQAESVLHLSRPALLSIGCVCLLVPVLYCAGAWAFRGPFTVIRWSFELPELRLAAAQVVVGTLNFAFVAACLDQILSASFDVGYLATASTYVLANAATLLSHVPGGLGVIESVVVYLIPGEGVLPYVLVFRFTYFLLPLAIGSTLFAATELVRGRSRLRVGH
jgi:hypothetical protein